MGKRILSWVLTFALLLSFAPALELEVTAVTEEAIIPQASNSTIGYTWDEETKTLTITGEGPMDDYRLNNSQQYNVYPSWAWVMTTAQKIVIDEGITYVGKNAFWDMYHECSALKELVIADSVESIGPRAFYRATSLEKVTFGKGLKSVEEFAFCGCTEITQVCISDLKAYCGINYVGVYSSPLEPDNSYLYLNGTKVTSLVIPDGITEIGESAFADCKLTSVKIPESVTVLGHGALCGNDFTSVVLPSEIKELNNAVAGCKRLQSVTLPPNLQKIGYNAFANCKSLKTVTIPQTVMTIGAGAFVNCTALTNLTLPDNLESIGNDAFFGCSNLETIEIPDKVSGLGENAFYNCERLTSVKLPKGVTEISNGLFYGCSRLTSIVIPEGVTTIGSAFVNCSSLQEISIPEGVTTISGSFSQCASLKSITLPESLEELGRGSFDGCTSLSNIEIPDTVKTIDMQSMFAKCTNLRSVTLPNTLSEISENAFNGCSQLTSISIPAQVAKIGDHAFYNCTSLDNIYFNGHAPTIADNAFYGVKASCYYPKEDESYTATIRTSSYGGDLFWKYEGQEKANLCGNAITWELSEDGKLILTGTGAMFDYAVSEGEYAPWYENRANFSQIIVQNGITHIGNGAFYNCTSAEYIEIPDTVVTIGERAFQNSAISNIKLPSNLQEIGKYSFSGTKLVDIVLPDRLSEIPASAFASCKVLKDIKFPEHLVTIGNYAFSNCYKLNSIVLPEGLVSIGNGAFGGCGWKDYGGYSFESVTLPSSVRNIGAGAFSWCTSLTSINIPEGIKEIQEQTFYRCAISELTLPSSIQIMGDYAFAYCYSLKTVVFSGDAPEFGKNALDCIYNKSAMFMNAYYPASNSTWTEDVRQNYGGKVVWIAYNAPSGEDGSTGSEGSGGEGIPGGDTDESGGGDSGSGDSNSGSDSGSGDGSGGSGGGSGNGSDSGTVGISVSISDTSSFGATVQAPVDGWKEGENTFTVTCARACAVAVSYDGGTSYTRLIATAVGENTYSFKVSNLTSATKICVALMGDVNGDGVLTSADLIALKSYLLDKGDLPVESLLAADVNKSQTVTTSDRILLKSALLEKATLEW